MFDWLKTLTTPLRPIDAPEAEVTAENAPLDGADAAPVVNGVAGDGVEPTAPVARPVSAIVEAMSAEAPRGPDAFAPLAPPLPQTLAVAPFLPHTQPVAPSAPHAPHTAALAPQTPHAAPLSPPTAPVATPAPSWSERLKSGLARTRQAVGLNRLFASKLDEASLELLENALLSADTGIAATTRLLDDLRARWKNQGGESGPSTPRALLRDALADLLKPLEAPLVIGAQRPFVIMLAGVNGAGKTTSIGKLAKYLQQQGHSVLLAAGDTFRAAAREQLVVWGERNGVMVIAQEGGDPAAVMFDAVQAARSRGIDVVLADTAGRLPTQLHLMDELRKIKRVITKADPGAPHEVLLVLDGNTGQNALGQLKAFDLALGVTGIVMTKLDGTAKGGVIAAIAATSPKPLRFIGVGERVDDLRPFSAREFAGALLDE